MTLLAVALLGALTGVQSRYVVWNPKNNDDAKMKVSLDGQY